MKLIATQTNQPMTKHDYIESTVCALYGIDPELIKHGLRFEEFLLPRQLTIYLLNEFSDRINKGDVMGRYGLNRATFYNCIKAIDGLRKNTAFEAEYQKLRKIVEIGFKYGNDSEMVIKGCDLTGKFRLVYANKNLFDQLKSERK